MTEEEAAAFWAAYRAKQREAAELLLSTPAIDAQSGEGCTALSLAAEEGAARIVRLLLSAVLLLLLRYLGPHEALCQPMQPMHASEGACACERASKRVVACARE